MSVMPDENIFVLTCTPLHATIYTTPTNWGDMEMQLMVEQFAVKRETTNTLSFIGDAAALITSARAGNYPVVLSLYRRANDWSTPLYRSWTADMKTYKRSGDTVSVGFASSTARDEIEKNRGTKYEIPLPSTHILRYTGIDRDATNMVSGLVKKIDDSDPLHSLDNWILAGNHSQSEVASLTVNNFKFTATEAGTWTVRVKIGYLSIGFKYSWWDMDAKLILGRYKNGKLLEIVRTWTSSFGPKDYVKLLVGYEYYHSIVNSGDYETLSVTMGAGEDLRLFFNTTKRPDYINIRAAADLRMEVVTFESSTFTDYEIRTIRVQDCITELLAKMCGTITPPTLTYSLTHFYEHVLTSSQGMTQTPDPILTISFDDVMKHLLCTDGADYEVTDGAEDDNTITIAPASTFKSGTAVKTIDVVGTVETEHNEGLVFGTVRVGFETDEDAENGTFEPLCINTFKLGDSDNELDLVSPFKGSPTTIEAFLRDKNASSSTTKESDTSVFCFATNAFSGGYTTLYKGQTIVYSPNVRVVNSNYFNVPFSPMRMLIANGAWLKVSKWNDATPITFLSTERTSQMATLISGDIQPVTEYNGTSPLLLTAMATPLYLPESITVECFTDLWTKAELNTWPRGYFTAYDKKSGNTYNFYVFDLTLPLTKRKTTSFSGVRKN